MNQNEQEIEVKFYVRDLSAVQTHLTALGAQLLSSRVFERNLRFDSPDGDLLLGRRVLRLRQPAHPGSSPQAGVLTYKSPGLVDQEVKIRQEIEVVVSSFTTTQHLLEALGYRVVMIYEKWRTTYHLNGLEIVLDELPYGYFVEIEGNSADEIRRMSQQLNLNWELRSMVGYLTIFDQLQMSGLTNARQLTFDELAGRSFTAAELGMVPADGD